MICYLKSFQTFQTIICFHFSGKHVLTAAHCCAVAKNYVTLGENRDIKVSIKSLRDHPKFSSKEYNYDLCIVTLTRDITKDTNIKDQTEIALLPVGGDCDKNSLDVNATGWGYFTGCIFFVEHNILVSTFYSIAKAFEFLI